MRAALLPTPGDPFMLAYWLRNFETWADQVDELVVLVNGQDDSATAAYLLGLMPMNRAWITVMSQRIGHDGALRWLLTNTDAEHVVLCEDDAYVRHPEMVGEAFRAIEQGRTDLVGSPRHEDYAGQTQEWGPYRPGDLTELRHGLWPAFLFARRADLLTTDREFGDRAWGLGDEIGGWGTVTPEACEFVGIAPDHVHLDTLFGTTFQLRAKGLRADLVHHVRLFDAAAAEQWIAEDPPWFHITGLSTLDYVLDGRPLELVPDLDEHGGLWTRRMAWWLRTYHEASQFTPGHRERGEALGRFIERTGMRTADIKAWHDRFGRWAAVGVPALTERRSGRAVVSEPTPSPDPTQPDPTLRIRHHVPRDHATSERRPCVWCGRPTDVWAETPFAPELGALPLMLTCGAHMRIVYRMLQRGEPIDAWEAKRVAALRQMMVTA